ncbi:hypothetical protein [Cyclobacterium amurskyense]|uniref:Plasmid stabilization system n=1 Tax=Cyclobacterium amurskyense TaxID=320787 RepID=A0A0H4PI60_9BACT|nr:hypothetical protein [Cyclobacterium amurskyense]AKP52568.1 hypothetical protein CA2015_3170 [Cyclobacterium amurskyense]
MRIVYTEQSLESLEESINHLLNRVDSLITDPHTGQYEEYLEHLGKGHRRLVEGYFKIIYLIEGRTIYIMDFFDTIQAPENMKG